MGKERAEKSTGSLGRRLLGGMVAGAIVSVTEAVNVISTTQTLPITQTLAPNTTETSGGGDPSFWDKYIIDDLGLTTFLIIVIGAGVFLIGLTIALMCVCRLNRLAAASPELIEAPPVDRPAVEPSPTTVLELVQVRGRYNGVERTVGCRYPNIVLGVRETDIDATVVFVHVATIVCDNPPSRRQRSQENYRTLVGGSVPTFFNPATLRVAARHQGMAELTLYNDNDCPSSRIV